MRKSGSNSERAGTPISSTQHQEPAGGPGEVSPSQRDLLEVPPGEGGGVTAQMCRDLLSTSESAKHGSYHPYLQFFSNMNLKSVFMP